MTLRFCDGFLHLANSERQRVQCGEKLGPANGDERLKHVP